MWKINWILQGRASEQTDLEEAEDDYRESHGTLLIKVK